MTALVDAGMVEADWNQNEYNGFVTNSVVVFAVRPGNPENIQTWDDLLQEGVEVITPNPFTSGGAQWNIMAAYGAQLEQGKSDEEAIAYLRELFLEHVPVQDKSAREALQTFAGGKGDVMLAYENEAIFAQQAGEELEYVVPEETILIENPAAVVNTGESPEAAQAFVDFLYTPEAQAVFASKGYRPVVEGVETEFDSSGPAGLFTIEDLGGWPDVKARFFDREESIFLDIENELGVPTDELAPSGMLPARPGSSRRAGGLVLGLSTAYLTLIVLIPIAAVVAASLSGGLVGLLGRGDLARQRSRRSS